MINIPGGVDETDFCGNGPCMHAWNGREPWRMHALGCAIHEKSQFQTIVKVCWVWFFLLLYVGLKSRNFSPVWSLILEGLRFNGWNLCSSLAIVICCSFLLCSCRILVGFEWEMKKNVILTEFWYSDRHICWICWWLLSLKLKLQIVLKICWVTVWAWRGVKLPFASLMIWRAQG